MAVFVHSSWYFSSPDELKKAFAMLRGKAKRLCIAEYALSARERDLSIPAGALVSHHCEKIVGNSGLC